MLKNFIILILLVIFIVFCKTSFAQVSVWQETRRGSVYISGGYNSYTDPTSTIHVEQGDLKNSYDLLNVTGQKTSNTGSSSPLGLLTFNLGYFFNYNQTWALEIGYTPFNFYVSDNQTTKIKGMKSGLPIDTSFVFSGENGNHYYINSGSSFMTLDIVRRYPLYRSKGDRNLSFDLFGKAGIGPVFVKPDNQLDSNKNAPKFNTSGGWDVDAAAGLRATIYRHVFIEFIYKYTYISANNVDVYHGTASQDMKFGAMNFNLGFIMPTTKHNPLFRKGEKRRKGLPNGPEPRGDLPKPKTEGDEQATGDQLKSDKPVILKADKDTEKGKEKEKQAEKKPEKAPEKAPEKTPEPEKDK